MSSLFHCFFTILGCLSIFACSEASESPPSERRLLEELGGPSEGSVVSDPSRQTELEGIICIGSHAQIKPSGTDGSPLCVNPDGSYSLDYNFLQGKAPYVGTDEVRKLFYFTVPEQNISFVAFSNDPATRRFTHYILCDESYFNVIRLDFFEDENAASCRAFGLPIAKFADDSRQELKEKDFFKQQNLTPAKNLCSQSGNNYIYGLNENWEPGIFQCKGEDFGGQGLSLSEMHPVKFCKTGWPLADPSDEDIKCPDEFPKSKFSFSTHDPTLQSVVIENKGNQEVKIISLELNGEPFYLSDFHVTHAALDPSSPYRLESSAKRIWRFANRNIYDQYITGSFWGHSPTITYNSTGLGICDDSAASVAIMSVYAGIKGYRVWDLQGHVVSELWNGNRWEMYDAHRDGVYYHNAMEEIADVEELASDPFLITSPISPIQPVFREDGNKQDFYNYYAPLYTTTENNSFNSTQAYLNVQGKIDFSLRIPPSGRIQFPGRFAPKSPVINIDGTSVEEYMDMKISYPSGWAGAVKMPLMIHDIEGRGVVAISLNGSSTQEFFQIGSLELQSLIQKRRYLIREIEIVRSDEAIDLIYFINPIRFTLKASNSIMLGGVGVSQLSLETVDLFPTEQVPLNVFQKFETRPRFK